MKLMAVAALVCGFVAAPMMAAGIASGAPACDGADCVPYVNRNAAQGVPCTLATRYVFGFDSSGSTLVCSANNQWVRSAPLIGVRTERQPCDGSTGAAQSPDGIPLKCIWQGWTPDYGAVYFPPPAGA